MPPINATKLVNNITVNNLFFEDVSKFLNPEDIICFVEAYLTENRLIFATKTGKLASFIAFIQSLPLNDQQISSYLFRKFYLACQNGELHMAKILLKKNLGNLNQLYEGIAPPLFIASQQGHLKLVQLLTAQEGININQCSSTNISPLYIACHNGHQEIVEHLLDIKDIEVNLEVSTNFPATRENYHRAVSKYKGKLFGDWSRYTSTPLSIACEKGHLLIVKLFLKNSNINLAKVLEYRQFITTSNQANICFNYIESQLKKSFTDSIRPVK